MTGHTETGLSLNIFILEAHKICNAPAFLASITFINHLFFQNKNIRSVVKECLYVN